MAYLLANLLKIYWYILLIRVILSWFNTNPYNPLIRILYTITEPVLAPVRRVIPPMGGLDLSPFVVFAALWFLMRLL